MGHHSQTKHGGEGEEGREACHLAEHTLLALGIVVDGCQHGLCHLIDGVRYKRTACGVPFVGLVINSHGIDMEDMTKDKRQHLLVDGGEDVSDQ